MIKDSFKKLLKFNFNRKILMSTFIRKCFSSREGYFFPGGGIYSAGGITPFTSPLYAPGLSDHFDVVNGRLKCSCYFFSSKVPL